MDIIEGMLTPKELEDDHWFQNKQEALYIGHQQLCWYSWYRKLFGGKWRLIKSGRDTHDIRLFSFWTKIPVSGFSGLSGYYEVYDQCEYPLTGVDTKKKLFKQFFKQIFKND